MGEEKRLTRRPLHGTASEEVDMQVGDGFAAIGAIVDDEAEPIFVESMLARDFSSSEHEVTEESVVIRGGFGDSRDGFARDEQVVDRRLRGNVFETNAVLVFVDDVCGDFFRADFFE